MIFGNKKKVIGLDIGSHSIKLAEVEVSKKGAVELTSFGLIPTPANGVSSGEITDIGGICAAIQMLMNEIKSKAKIFSTGMWGTSVIVKKITIPRVDSKILKDQIRFEAEQYIPFDINNITLAHHILNTHTSPETMDVLLIAAQNELVLQYFQVGEISGMQNSILDVSGFALSNCFEINYGMQSQCIGLLNFGATITNFVAIQNGEIIFCRDIPVGGINYTTEIHKSMGLSMDESESMKLSASANQEVPDEVQSVISATNEMVVEEVRNSLDFLSATNNGLNINKFYYSGGASLTPGLMPLIGKSTGVSFELFDCFSKIATPKRYSPSYLDQIRLYAPIAMGLGLRRVGDHD